MESGEESDEEVLLLNAMTRMMEGDNGDWRRRWIQRGLESVLRSPVSAEAKHIALLLKNGCKQEQTLLTTCFEQLMEVISSTHDNDIKLVYDCVLTCREGLLTVLLTLLLPHSSQVIQNCIHSFYPLLYEITQAALSRVTVVNVNQFPKDAVSLLLVSFRPCYHS